MKMEQREPKGYRATTIPVGDRVIVVPHDPSVPIHSYEASQWNTIVSTSSQRRMELLRKKKEEVDLEYTKIMGEFSPTSRFFSFMRSTCWVLTAILIVTLIFLMCSLIYNSGYKQGVSKLNPVFQSYPLKQEPRRDL
jgi:hypothetical protein